MRLSRLQRGNSDPRQNARAKLTWRRSTHANSPAIRGVGTHEYRLSG